MKIVNDNVNVLFISEVVLVSSEHSTTVICGGYGVLRMFLYLMYSTILFTFSDN